MLSNPNVNKLCAAAPCVYIVTNPTMQTFLFKYQPPEEATKCIQYSELCARNCKLKLLSFVNNRYFFTKQRRITRASPASGI